jgi:hypothetical protein
MVRKRKPWFFAYPYGGYTMATLGLLDAAGCAAALTVKDRSRNAWNVAAGTAAPRCQ